MSQNSNFFTCRNICWILFIIGGLILWWILSSPIGWFWALVIAIIAVVLAGKFLIPVFCRAPEPMPRELSGAGAGGTAASGAVAGGAGSATPGATASAAPATPPAPASAPESAPESAPATESVDPEPTAEAASAANDEPDEDTGAAPTSTAAPAGDTEAATVSDAPASGTGSDATAAPAMSAGGDAGEPDDLTRIKGVGPGLAKGLVENGITTFAQIAAWGPEEIHWADNDLAKFKGRCTRDDWVGQAKVLAGGGTTEFAQRVDKGEVYD